MTDGRLSNGSPMPMKTAVEHKFLLQNTAFVAISNIVSLEHFVLFPKQFLAKSLKTASKVSALQHLLQMQNVLSVTS